MKRLIFLGILSVFILSVSKQVLAAPVKYTDVNAWKNAVSALTTIDFDDVNTASPAPFQTTISGNRYSGLPFGPTLTPGSGDKLAVGAPSRGFFIADFIPTSNDNVFAPGLTTDGTPMGKFTLNFSTPVRALGAWFLDVEAGFANTGFETNGGGSPNVAFSGNKGDNSQAFLGFILDDADASLSSVVVHLNSTASPSDGVGLDDLMYAVPIPGAAWVLGCLVLGYLGLGTRKNWFRRS